MQEKKNLPWLFGADRKNLSLGQTVILGWSFFYLHLTPMKYSYYMHCIERVFVLIGCITCFSFSISAVKKQLAMTTVNNDIHHSPRPEPRPDSTPQSNMSSPKTPASG